MCETGVEIQDIEGYLASLRVCRTEAARQLTFLAAFAAEDQAEGDGEFTHLEIAAVSRVSPRFAQTRLELAQTLVARLPRTLRALGEGAIDEYRAQRVASATEVLSDDLAAAVEEKLIPTADQCNPQQLNRKLRRAVTLADPQAATARAKAKNDCRHIRHDDVEDGAGLLQIQGNAERTQMAFQRIKTIARQLKSTGDERTVDQIAADVALDC